MSAIGDILRKSVAIKFGEAKNLAIPKRLSGNLLSIEVRGVLSSTTEFSSITSRPSCPSYKQQLNRLSFFIQNYLESGLPLTKWPSNLNQRWTDCAKILVQS